MKARSVSAGLTVLRRRIQKYIRLVYSHDVQYVRGRIVHDPIVELNTSNNDKIECIVVESVASLRRFENEILNSFRDSAERLKKRLYEGRIVIFALKRTEAQRHAIIGYILAERGVFSALGRKLKIAPDLLFGHYIEVLPPYRQSGVAKFLLHAMDEYCFKNGITKYCGSVSSRNSAAMTALATKSNEVVGKVKRISIFGGIFIWETPSDAIKKAIDAIGKKSSI
jgi:GNAT superfamily N-acetyltransferase